MLRSLVVVEAFFLLAVFSFAFSAPTKQKILPQPPQDLNFVDSISKSITKIKQNVNDAENFHQIGNSAKAKKVTGKTVTRENFQKSAENKNADQILMRSKRYVLEGSKWHKSHLKYNIQSYPVTLPERDVRHEIQRAFDEWSKYTNLKFTPVNDSDEADFKIEFVEGSHDGERYFDGPEGILAHAFYPQYGGKIQFDITETWTIGNPEGKDLFQVAVHEVGHALGLKHSNDESSVMWPRYSKYIPDPQLSQDDINAIQALYGPKSNEATNTEQILCDGKGIDTVLSTSDGIYMFKGIYYWFLGDIKSSKPEAKLITDTWTAIPGDIDAAFTDRKGRIYFFKGNRYWRYRGNQLDNNYPRKISKAFPGIPDDIDGVFGKFEGKQKLYFFKGKYYYKFVPSKKPKLESIYPRLISKRWDGLSKKVDAVIRQSDGKIYFFDGNYNYIFDDDVGNTQTSKPTRLQSIVQWSGCKDLD